MIEGGDDPLYLARRLVRMASEDIGLADPHALEVVIAARDAYHFLGAPEGELALAEAAVYLALAPKSNRVYAAWKSARQAARETPGESVPLHLRNAPTGLMKTLGYGKGYQYEPDTESGVSGVSPSFRSAWLAPSSTSRGGSGTRRPWPSAIAWFEARRAEARADAPSSDPEA